MEEEKREYGEVTSMSKMEAVEEEKKKRCLWRKSPELRMERNLKERPASVQQEGAHLLSLILQYCPRDRINFFSTQHRSRTGDGIALVCPISLLSGCIEMRGN